IFVFFIIPHTDFLFYQVYVKSSRGMTKKRNPRVLRSIRETGSSQSVSLYVIQRKTPAASRVLQPLLLIVFLCSRSGIDVMRMLLPDLIGYRSPFFRRVSALCTELVDILRRLYIRTVRAAAVDHFRQLSGVVQKRTRPQHIVVKRLIVVIFHEH